MNPQTETEIVERWRFTAIQELTDVLALIVQGQIETRNDLLNRLEMSRRVIEIEPASAAPVTDEHDAIAMARRAAGGDWLDSLHPQARRNG